MQNFSQSDLQLKSDLGGSGSRTSARAPMNYAGGADMAVFAMSAIVRPAATHIKPQRPVAQGPLSGPAALQPKNEPQAELRALRYKSFCYNVRDFRSHEVLWTLTWS